MAVGAGDLTTMNDLTNGEWIGLISLALTTISGVVAGTIKLVMNGSAQRIKETHTLVTSHMADTKAQFQKNDQQFDETKALVEIRHREMQKDLTQIKDTVHNVDIRVARIEGGRWKRTNDET